MSDIRTIDFVDVDGHRVAVAAAGDEYEAAVVATHMTKLYQAMKTAFSLGEDTGEWRRLDGAPRVYDSQRYTAVGKAVAAYERMLADEAAAVETADE